MNSADPQQVVLAARSWLGTPYHNQASVKGVGCDCLGLVRGVWREVVGDESYKVPPYTPDWGETGSREIIAEESRRWLIEISPREATTGDVLVFRMWPRVVAKHMGILTSDSTFIHAYNRLGCIEQELGPWRRKVAFAFRYPARKEG
jgi:NlpC/P60 family putative phage cell wall peptidase